MSSPFTVNVANNAREAIAKLLTEKIYYDAVVLDLGLPDKSGDELCEAIRAEGITIPILILTGDNQTNTKVRLLEVCGADDYLTKPFKLVELQARLNALIRRNSGKTDRSTIKIAGLSIDPAFHSVERDGITITLRRKEFDILEYLARNPGRVVTRQMIMRHVWESDHDSWSNLVDVHVKYLRDKIDRPFGQPLLKTVYGLGYTLNAN